MVTSISNRLVMVGRKDLMHLLRLNDMTVSMGVALPMTGTQYLLPSLLYRHSTK
jgi:hypothetical protein